MSPAVRVQGKWPVKGASERNLALDYLTSSRTEPSDGVVYFADDDNTYDSRLFEEVKVIILGCDIGYENNPWGKKEREEMTSGRMDKVTDYGL